MPQSSSTSVDGNHSKLHFQPCQSTNTSRQSHDAGFSVPISANLTAHATDASAHSAVDISEHGYRGVPRKAGRTRFEDRRATASAAHTGAPKSNPAEGDNSALMSAHREALVSPSFVSQALSLFSPRGTSHHEDLVGFLREQDSKRGKVFTERGTDTAREEKNEKGDETEGAGTVYNEKDI